MAGTLNDTPGSNRLHIGVFGKTNSGKSSFINAFTPVSYTHLTLPTILRV